MYYPNPYMGHNYPNSVYDQKELSESLKLIKEAVEGEKDDELFYNYLIKLAPTQEERDILSSIRDDQLKHNKMFRQIYKDYTGKEILNDKDVDFEPPLDYIDGIIKLLFEELEAVEKYRKIRQGLVSHHHRDMLFEIITDELKHSSKYNYIYTKNSTDNINGNVTVNEDENDNVNEGKGLNNRTGTTSSKNFTMDEWEKLIEPLMKKSDSESKEIILASILVGSGCDPNDAVKKVEEWGKSNGKGAKDL